MLVWGRIMSLFFIRVFLECDVSNFAVRVETWVESSAIVFDNSATEVMSDFAAVARFARSRV